MSGVVDSVTDSRWSISNTGGSCRSCAMTLTSYDRRSRPMGRRSPMFGACRPRRIVLWSTLVAEGNEFFLLGAPRWNPKSDKILYRHLIKPDQSEFFIATLTGAHTRVPLAQRPYLADWTSDGAGIVYLFQGFAQGTDYFLGTGVRTAKRDGSGDRELLYLPGLSDLVVVGYP